MALEVLVAGEPAPADGALERLEGLLLRGTSCTGAGADGHGHRHGRFRERKGGGVRCSWGVRGTVVVLIVDKRIERDDATAPGDIYWARLVQTGMNGNCVGSRHVHVVGCDGLALQVLETEEHPVMRVPPQDNLGSQLGYLDPKSRTPDSVSGLYNTWNGGFRGSTSFASTPIIPICGVHQGAHVHCNLSYLSIAVVPPAPAVSNCPPGSSIQLMKTR